MRVDGRGKWTITGDTKLDGEGVDAVLQGGGVRRTALQLFVRSLHCQIYEIE